MPTKRECRRRGSCRDQTAFTATTLLIWSLGSASCIQAQDYAVEGLWGNFSDIPDHPSWRIEDQLMGGGPRVAYDHLASLLDDPANDERSLQELVAEAQQTGMRHLQELLLGPIAPRETTNPTDDPRIQCEPLGLIGIISAPRVFLIDVEGSELVIHHEQENTIRRIPLGSGDAAIQPSQLGTSVARFEGTTLVVETTGIGPTWIPPGIETTADLRIIERFIPDENDPDRLEYEIVRQDPGTLREPLVSVSPRVRIDGEIFIEEPCEVIYQEPQ